MWAGPLFSTSIEKCVGPGIIKMNSCDFVLAANMMESLIAGSED